MASYWKAFMNLPHKKVNNNDDATMYLAEHPRKLD